MALEFNKSSKNSKKLDDDSVHYGKIIANPPKGESVVITGMSGQFPSSSSIKDYAENLLNKIDMVTPTIRWPEMPNVPKRNGQLPDLTRLDNSFFGIPYWIAYGSDPMVRLFLERSIEAVFDAGCNLKDLEGTRTGVFVGACNSESESLHHDHNSWTGITRSMIANRVSYFLKLKGPSFICDCACSSSLTALEHAYQSIRTGECDAAIVGGVNVCLHPNVSYQFYSLGVLSMDGACKPFDDSGNGYARSEAVCALFIQKSKDAKRIYANILHAKLNCDGYKEKGITFPSGETQAKLLKEIYEEAGVHPDDISFFECHGTGTIVGDPEEAMALDKVFCKKRKSPLLVGSCKSSVGHSEPASGLCSIIKCLVAFETGYIPPNLHYSKPRAGVKVLEEGRLKVVTEKTPLPKGKSIIGVSSFGFGGANCHVILSSFDKEKINKGIPEDNLPRLVCVSGRVPDAIASLLDKVKEGFDGEFVRFFHHLFGDDIKCHVRRGFSILSKTGEKYRSMKLYSGSPPILFILFGGFDNDWSAIAEQMFQLPLFVATVQKVYDILIKKEINIVDIIMQKRKKSLPEQILGNVLVQLGFVDVLKAINLNGDLIFGNGINELVAAYYDNVLSWSQVIECVYIIIKLCENQKNLLANSLYLIEVNANMLTQFIHPPIFVKSINENRSLVYCPASASTNFINTIESNGFSVIKYLGQQIDYKNMIKKADLVQHFEAIMSKPKRWSEKHLLHPNELADAEYFANYILGSTYFNNSFKSKAKNKSIMLEVGSSQLETVIREIMLKRFKYYQITSSQESFVNFLQVLGRLYEEGFCTKLDKLYPEIQFPVSRQTPSIASSIKWYHEKEWFVPHNTRPKNTKLGERIFKFQIKHPNFAYLTGHNIDGRNLFPASGYLRLVWEVLFLLEDEFGLESSEEMKIVFRNCKFMRATTIPKESSLILTVMIQLGTGNFEVSEGTVPIVKGNVQSIKENKTCNLVKFQQLQIDDAEIKMKTKDIYKELRLRGYNYSGGFKSIQECNISATEGLVKWDDNWITFIDSLFQIKILQYDTRFLYVPTSVTKLTIDAKKHYQIVKSLENNSSIPIRVMKEADIVRCGGVELVGLKASSIARRKDLSDPVLEKHQFVPNISENLTLDEAVRVNIQLLLENAYNSKLKVIEIIDEFTNLELKVLAPIVNAALGDQPIVKAETIILSTSVSKFEGCDNIQIESKPLGSHPECSLIIGTQFLSRSIFLQEAFRMLKENCYILSREPKDVDLQSINDNEVNIITVFTLEKERLVLISKPKTVNIYEIIDISKDMNFSWLDSVKNAAKRDGNVLILCENDRMNGILGLVNCLRRELNSGKIRCIFLMDPAPPFDLNKKFYNEQIQKNLAVNIYKNGNWGTYRHLLLKVDTVINCEHSFVNVNSPGDLSSLTWVQGPLSRKKHSVPERTLVNVYYSAINFRDIMTAAGKINADVITTNRLMQGCVQGFEFCGRLENGQRVMGMITSGALSTLVEADNAFLWNVPSNWTMVEAATVPVCYSTVIWALLQKAKLKKGNTILIHSGTGGIGQAAINIALYVGCIVFTTVGTPEKRKYLKDHFPQLQESHIGCSRDLSFVEQIMKMTHGKGVDIVLNSLAEEKLLASVNCVKQNGHFVEIGKFDLASNNILKLMVLKKNVSFHGIMLDHLFEADPYKKQSMRDIIIDLIDLQAIKPLNVNLFESNNVEKAFRFMGTGKHIGKVLLEICKEENEQSGRIMFNPDIKGNPRYYCNEQETSIIIGGLGGFGLELADWLILRGAKKVVLTSRKGIQNGYQAFRIKVWQSYGVTVHISTADVTTEEGCQKLLEEALNLGPVEAIFNLAVVLKDALIENQNDETFKLSFGPKAVATYHLDKLSRTMCPHLRLFVVFSSVSCGRGNGGQTNYGMANSIMERICERRHQKGLPGLAIQWGAVGDVGLVADMQEEHKEIEIGGTLQQRIFNCLKVLDIFLTQKHAAIVSSMVVAEKRTGGSENVVDVIADILGIKDLKAVSLHTTFPEMGMDSMTAVEIKQTLERDYEIFLTAQDIRGMTFARLLEIQENRLTGDSTEITPTDLLGGVDLMLRLLGDEKLNNIPILELNCYVSSNENMEPVLFFPGVEGVATVLDPLVRNLNVKAYGVQFGCVYEKDSIKELAEAMIPYIKPILKSKYFQFVAYSFGVMFALEVVAILESLGYKGKMICIDGSPQYLKELTNLMETDCDEKLQTNIILKIISFRMKLEDVEKLRAPIMKCESLEERIVFAQNLANEKLEAENKISNSHLRQLFISTYKRIKGVIEYSPSFSAIKSEVELLKCEFSSLRGLSSDYGLSKICGRSVKTMEVKANHITILENPIVATYIKDSFAENLENNLVTANNDLNAKQEEFFSQTTVPSGERAKII